MTEKEKTLDLATLEWVKFFMGLHSDMTTKTNGYKQLCRIIDELKKSPLEYNNPCNVKIGWDVLRVNSKCPLCNDTGTYITGGSFGGSVEYHKCTCSRG